jgi:hypothetical protein
MPESATGSPRCPVPSSWASASTCPPATGPNTTSTTKSTAGRSTTRRRGSTSSCPASAWTWGTASRWGVGGPGLPDARARGALHVPDRDAGGPAVLADVEADGFGAAGNVGIRTGPPTAGLWGCLHRRDPDRPRGEVHRGPDRLAAGRAFSQSGAHYRVKSENTWPRSLGVGTAYRFDYAIASVEFPVVRLVLGLRRFHLPPPRRRQPGVRRRRGNDPERPVPAPLARQLHGARGRRVPGHPGRYSAGRLPLRHQPHPRAYPDAADPGILEHSVTVGTATASGGWGSTWPTSSPSGAASTVDTSSVIGGDFDSSSLQAFAHWFFVG